MKARKLEARQKIALRNPVGRANEFDIIGRLGARQVTGAGLLSTILSVNR